MLVLLLCIVWRWRTWRCTLFMISNIDTRKFWRDSTHQWVFRGFVEICQDTRCSGVSLWVDPWQLCIAALLFLLLCSTSVCNHITLVCYIVLYNLLCTFAFAVIGNGLLVHHRVQHLTPTLQSAVNHVKQFLLLNLLPHDAILTTLLQILQAIGIFLRISYLLLSFFFFQLPRKLIVLFIGFFVNALVSMLSVLQLCLKCLPSQNCTLRSRLTKSC